LDAQPGSKRLGFFHDKSPFAAALIRRCCKRLSAPLLAHPFISFISPMSVQGEISALSNFPVTPLQ
jgi:hypothetical protein